MLFTLGVGSEVTMAGSVITVVCDSLPNYKRWKITAILSAIGFLLGIVYVTPVCIFIYRVTVMKKKIPVPIIYLLSLLYFHVNRVGNSCWTWSITSEEVCHRLIF